MISLSQVRKISMLDTPILDRLRHLAREGGGGILEIGSYIGGSTIALASGHEGRRKHAVIDAGGQYLEHATLPSADILGDWHQNVAAFGVADHVRMFAGWSTDSRAFRAALKHVDYDIGLFFFDGDGRCADQFSIFAPYMRPGAIIVLDDYVQCGADQVKANLVRPWVQRMTELGALTDGEVADGTWFGRLGLWSQDTFRHFRHEQGHAYYAPATTPEEGPVRVLENGVELGPGASMHDKIRNEGGGAFSHWIFEQSGPYVLFSTSDNSDPNSNGRKYEFLPSWQARLYR